MYRYYEIADQLKMAFLGDGYTQGDKLPSVRQICETYKCHQNTACKAYEILREQGLVYVIPQSGYYLSMDSSEERGDNQFVYDFAAASPDPNLFPYRDYQLCINQAIKQHREALFRYGERGGHLPLKRAVSKLMTDDYIFTDPEQIVITSGTQQLLSILSKMNFTNQKEVILVEQPSYHLYLEALRHMGSNVKWIERQAAGYDFEIIEKLFREGNIKFFYLLPRVHNPLGTALSKRSKERLVELAYRYNVYLVEDDYMGDYELNPANDPLIAYDVHKSHVLYLKSFSKIVFPGLRIGFAILPKSMVTEVETALFYHDMGASLLSQASLDIFIRNGMYQRRIKKMKTLYHQRAVALQDSISVLSGEASPKVHACIELKRAISLKKAAYFGIQLTGIDRYYYERAQVNHRLLPINVSNVKADRIQAGIEKLFKLIDERKI